VKSPDDNIDETASSICTADRTGIAGRFDIHLEVTPDDLQPKFVAGRAIEQQPYGQQKTSSERIVGFKGFRNVDFLFSSRNTRILLVGVA
jgi:hypothetical protein